ncbi:MAG: hypothetical protein KGD57_09440, partial [Candidatus Lokiarchaeota archaeon]|nr:hypothetical protein [Candidatus Lokiarchaeota archaeon]
MTKKIGYLSGIIAFLISLISKIPINPSENLEINFRLFVIDNTEYYIWGSLENGIISFSSMVSQFPENLIAIFIWCLVIFIGISSIIASNSNTKYNSSFKLYILNILFSAFLLI